MRWFKFQDAPPVAELAELSCYLKTLLVRGLGGLRPAVMLALAGLLSTSWGSFRPRLDPTAITNSTTGAPPACSSRSGPPYLFTHNVGLLTLQVTNVGIIGNPFIDDFRAGVAWRRVSV